MDSDGMIRQNNSVIGEDFAPVLSLSSIKAAEAESFELCQSGPTTKQRVKFRIKIISLQLLAEQEDKVWKSNTAVISAQKSLLRQIFFKAEFSPKYKKVYLVAQAFAFYIHEYFTFVTRLFDFPFKYHNMGWRKSVEKHFFLSVFRVHTSFSYQPS